MDTQTEHARMDDDGAPILRIGIAPAPRTFADVKAEQDAPNAPLRKKYDEAAARQHAEKPKLGLILPGQAPAGEPAKIIDARGEEASSLNWPDYLAWRKSKCRPYDYEEGPGLATSTKTADLDISFPKRDRAIEEIDQATHEFVGEVAELVELFLTHGPNVFYGDLRKKLIDECGDIFFCGAWALDAWGSNPLYGADDLEIVRVTDEDPTAQFAEILATKPQQEVFGNPRFMAMLGNACINMLLSASMNVGLTANSFKKLKFQRREQKVESQVERVCTAFFFVNQILIIANSSVEEALQSNQRKLNARFPEGYKPGVGGGIRTGEGA